MKTKVLVIDDSALIRSLLTEIINDTKDLEVVGTAPDPLVAREMIKQLNPDVLTLDVEMPRMDGLDFLEKLMRLRPMPVLMVSTLTEKGSEITLRALELALRWQGRGVVGFDLAGPEYGYPPGEHAEALARARAAGLAITLHAGEADAAERVLEAGRLGATRIGHGVRLVDALHDPARRALVDEALALGLHLEVCPTNNVQTGAAPSIAEHPITALWQAGLSLSYHTDNRLISRTTHTAEAAALLRDTPLTAADLLAMTVQAARASFMPASDKAQAEAAVRAFAQAQGLVLAG